MIRDSMWPELPYENWKDTLDTLHMWMQIVGKVKLALSPFINQWWEVTFSVTSQGMNTGYIPSQRGQSFQVDFDFIRHELTVQTSTGHRIIHSLRKQTVAAFYAEFMKSLKDLGIPVVIWPMPVEFTDPITFKKDTRHASYDHEFVTRWWRIQLRTAMVFDRFRTSFRGKSSPTQFFWGSFDLNGTRFSGKTVKPPKQKGVIGRIMKYAENEENFAFGFWPGDARYPHPAFYSYIYPAPNGIATVNYGRSASFNEQLGECILPYEVVRKTADPERAVLKFLNTTYQRSASLAGWDVKSLTGSIPKQKKPIH